MRGNPYRGTHYVGIVEDAFGFGATCYFCGWHMATVLGKPQASEESGE